VRFLPTPLAGVYRIELAPHRDERGTFARLFCRHEFAAHGLADVLAQVNVSYTRQRGTVRGLHYQAPPHAEAKLVCCIAGAIYDVIVDLRPGSPTYLQHVALWLAAGEACAVYVPEGCAHGFQTLTDDAGVLYGMSTFYAPQHARGVRYDDPLLAIAWPLPISVVAERDRGWPLLPAARR
jgi:dTDP-4-dehydrorhamnose 3,5-epimerase